MSNTSGPLDSVPVTGLRKRKAKRPVAMDPTSSDPQTNEPSSTIAPPVPPAETTLPVTTPTVTLPVAQPTPPQPTTQTDISSTSNTSDNVQTLGPLKKRKSKNRLNEFGSNDSFDSDNNNQIPSSSSTIKPSPSPTIIPVETNEIPDIDVLDPTNSTGTSDNMHHSSSFGSRMGLDTEQEHTLASRYMNPNFDLSKIGKNESKQLLNKSISREYCERFGKDMALREEQFRRDYVKPTQKADEQKVNLQFLMKELNNILESTAQSIQSASEDKFDFKKLNLAAVNDANKENDAMTTFKPNLNGLARTYTMTSKEAIDSLSGKHVLLSVNDLKSELDAAFVPTPPENEVIRPNYIKDVEILFNKSNKQISPTEFIIDLSMPESVRLFEKIASFFAIGLKCRASFVFDKLYSQMNEDSRGRANIVPLQTALVQAKAGINENSNGNYKFTVLFVLNLIQQYQCSALLRYMSSLLGFKSTYYYGDAMILDSELCLELADQVEKIECVQLKNISKSLSASIPENVPSVTGDRFALRISGSVDNYLKQTRNWLLQGVEINQEHLVPLAEILKLFARSFLAQTNGTVLAVDSLYEIFEGIARLNSDHPAHKTFVSIFQGKEVAKIWDVKSKIWFTIVLSLNAKILPYLILFGISIPQTKTVMNPAYFRDPIACLRIAHALLPMKYPNFNVRFDTIKQKVASLE